MLWPDAVAAEFAATLTSIRERRMRHIYTMAVVSSRIERKIRCESANVIERSLVRSRDADSTAYFWCMLDGWESSHQVLLQWFKENRAGAVPAWRRLLRGNVLFVRRCGKAFLSRPSSKEISRWYRHRSLGEAELLSFVNALYDGLNMHLGTGDPLVIIARCVGPSLSDKEY